MSCFTNASAPSSSSSASTIPTPYLRIENAWTKAGIASCVHVKGKNRENFLLDCGVAEIETLQAQWVFISHGHLDHAGACVSHARPKALTSPPSTYYIPKQIEEAFRMTKRGFELMDEREIPMNIVATQPGDEISLSPTLFVRVFATEHRVPSQGYMFFVRSRGSLKPEFEGRSSEEIRALKLSGVDILTPPTEQLDLVYTGDTTFQGLLRSPLRDAIFSAHTLITELTYLNGDRAKAAQWQHIHIDDVVEHVELFRNLHVVFVHISQKYSYSQAIELVRTALPPSLCERVSLSLRSFGMDEALTSLSSSQQWNTQRGRVAGWGWSNARAQHVSTTLGRGRGTGRAGGRNTQRERDRHGRSASRGRGRASRSISRSVSS